MERVWRPNVGCGKTTTSGTATGESQPVFGYSCARQLALQHAVSNAQQAFDQWYRQALPPLECALKSPAGFRWKLVSITIGPDSKAPIFSAEATVNWTGAVSCESPQGPID